MRDLIAFMRARLDEEEELARDAVQRQWLTTDNYVEDESGSSVARFEIKADARHAGAWGPARVLVDVAGKREVLKLCEFLLETRQVQEDADALSDYSLGRAQAGGSVLRLLALPYADHPDYDENWRP